MQVTALLDQEVDLDMPYLALAEFAKKYHLGKKTVDVLIDAGFNSAGGLLKVEATDLKGLDLKVGHFAELRRALDEWVQAVAKERL